MLAILIGCGGHEQAVPTSEPAATDRIENIDRIEKTVAVGNLSYVFRSSPTANLIFELDCLAELIACSSEAVAQEWQRDRFDAMDVGALASWKTLRQRYEGKIEDDTRPAEPPPFPLPKGPGSVATALRLAGFGVRDREDYLARLALFASTADVTRARDVLARFAPRGDKIWRDHADELRRAAEQYAALAARPEVSALIGKIAAFYRVELPPGSQQIFELVYRPPGEGTTYAEALGPVGVVEARSGEPPIRQFPVVAHEMFHAWFRQSPIDQQYALAVRFWKTRVHLAGPAYGLLDEALAAALGNGLLQRAVEPAELERLLALPEGLYADPLIDPAARALMPALERWLAAGKTIYDDGFVELYLDAIRQAFPSGLPPLAYLRPLGCATQEDLPGATQHLIEASGAGYAHCSSNPEEARAIVAGSTAWGTAVLVTPAGLAKLAGTEGILDAKTLAAARAVRARRFVLAQPRSPVGTVFVFVAPDDAALIELIDAFAAQRTTFAPGVFAP